MNIAFLMQNCAFSPSGTQENHTPFAEWILLWLKPAHEPAFRCLLHLFLLQCTISLLLHFAFASAHDFSFNECYLLKPFFVWSCFSDLLKPFFVWSCFFWFSRLVQLDPVSLFRTTNNAFVVSLMMLRTLQLRRCFCNAENDEADVRNTQASQWS